MAVSGTAGGRIAPGVGANLIGQHAQDRNQDATIYVGNLDAAVLPPAQKAHKLPGCSKQVTEEMVWELFTQAGPVVNVYLPKDRVTNTHQGYGFVEFRGEEDADYAIKVLNMIKVFAKPIRVNKASQDKKILDVGANLFIGNLDADVDEKLLYDTFGAFGVIIATPKIMRDPDNGNSRGFGFVSYDCFEAADSAIEAMNGQFLCNRPISVSYAFKKDTKGERHGTPAERLLAAQQRVKLAQMSRPHTLFAAGPRDQEALMQQMAAAQQGAPAMNTYATASYQDPAALPGQWGAAQQAYGHNADGTVPMWNGNGAAYGQAGWQSAVAPPPNMPPPPMMPPRPMHSMNPPLP